jgi:hypothetical protein
MPAKIKIFTPAGNQTLVIRLSPIHFTDRAIPDLHTHMYGLPEDCPFSAVMAPVNGPRMSDLILQELIQPCSQFLKQITHKVTF